MRKGWMIPWMAMLCLALLLCSCGGEPFAEYTLDGGMVCRSFGNEIGLTRLEVTLADGTALRFSLPRASLEPDPAGGLELIDLDFDGHLDLRIAYRKMVNGDMRYTCFLWRETGPVKSEQLSGLRGIEVDAEAERLTAWDHYIIPEEHESRKRTVYVWQDGTLWAVEQRELLYYLEEDIYCLVDSAAEPGQALAVTEERWIFADQFDENEIWN